MKRVQLTLFRRFSIIIFSVITVLGALFIIITYFATSYYHQAGTQLLAEVRRKNKLLILCEHHSEINVHDLVKNFLDGPLYLALSQYAGICRLQNKR